MDFVWVIPLVLQFQMLLALWRSPEERFRIYLDENERLIIPEQSAEVKILPLAYSDSIYASFPKINKKLPKYAKNGPKKCCGNKWAVDYKEVTLEELIQPVSLPSYRPPSIHEYGEKYEDVKPVTEHIEGDIKYDFRTKTHSLR